MRRRVGTLLATALLGASLLVVLAAPAGAVTITASQHDDLDPTGQTVDVSGSGYVPDIQLYLALCNPAAGPGACDMVNFKQVSVDGAGNFSASLHIAPQFGSTDCRTTPCAIQTSRVGMGSDRTQEATLPVTFTAESGSSAPGTAKDDDQKATSTTRADDRDAALAATSSGDDDSGGGSALPWVIVGVVVVAVAAAGAVVLRRRSHAG